MSVSKANSSLSGKSIIWLLILVIIINTSMLLIINIRYQDIYSAAYIDKIKLLVKTESPCIIFVGGSNVAFGINSEKIKQQTGYNTVNMGLSGNIGIKFMLEGIKHTLKSGDIVVIIPEYQHFLNKKNNLGPDFIQAIIANPSLIRYISSLDEVIYSAEIFPYVYTQAIKSLYNDIAQRNCVFCMNDEKIYYRNAFNEYGDIVSHENLHQTIEIPNFHLEKEYSNTNISKMITVINKFALYAEEKNAKVVFIYPATPSPFDDETIEVLNYLQTRLQKELIITVRGHPSDAWYSRGLFFDTYYHLTPEGRNINTERIINDLVPVIEE